MERAVLQFAEQLTRTTNASEEVLEILHDRLDDAEFVALATVVGFANWTNRFNHACGVELP